MYAPGQILYFTPFYFPNGNLAKNKYFIVLACVSNDLIVANLPTSRDHIPSFIEKKHGCINADDQQIGCYFFEKGKIISACETFAFPLDTYIYAEQVDSFNIDKLNEIYQTKDVDYQIVCELSDAEFLAIKDCLKNSSKTKRGVKKQL